MLRLDPLMLAAPQADELGLLPSLRREFGPEAHLSVTTARRWRVRDGRPRRAGKRGRRGAPAPAGRHCACRLTGTRPGILAMFVEDTDRSEWRGLRERLELEGEARQFLAYKAARPVVAVTCASRFELFGMAAPDAAGDGELRFRNPAHPARQSLRRWRRRCCRQCDRPASGNRMSSTPNP